MNIVKPGAHLDHMLRTTRLHHVQLSNMADVKANMMLTLTYRAQVRKLYTLGIFLATKKYRFVRLAYMSFISGLFVSGSVLFLLSQ